MQQRDDFLALGRKRLFNAVRIDHQARRSGVFKDMAEIRHGICGAQRSGAVAAVDGAFGHGPAIGAVRIDHGQAAVAHLNRAPAPIGGKDRAQRAAIGQRGGFAGAEANELFFSKQPTLFFDFFGGPGIFGGVLQNGNAPITADLKLQILDPGLPFRGGKVVRLNQEFTDFVQCDFAGLPGAAFGSEMAAVAMAIGYDGDRMPVIPFAQAHILAGQILSDMGRADVQGVKG